MHRGTVLLITVFQYLAMRMQPRVFWQQRRVDIQQAPLIMGDKRRTKDPHVACQHHQIRRISIDLMHQLAIEGFAIGKLAGRQRMGRDTGLTRTFKAERVGLIAEYRSQGAVNLLSGAGINYRLQIGSVTGNQHHNVFHSMTTRCSESEALI